MPLIFNLRHLERGPLHCKGELSPDELGLTDLDEMIDVCKPVRYDVTLESMSGGVLARGKLNCALDCECVRCLRDFSLPLDLDWTVDLALSGEEAVPVNNDCIDLTPHIREDILLAFPQHPLCEPGCRGLLDPEHNLNEPANVAEQANGEMSAWAELNKLKF